MKLTLRLKERHPKWVLIEVSHNRRLPLCFHVLRSDWDAFLPDLEVGRAVEYEYPHATIEFR